MKCTKYEVYQIWNRRVLNSSKQYGPTLRHVENYLLQIAERTYRVLKYVTLQGLNWRKREKNEIGTKGNRGESQGAMVSSEILTLLQEVIGQIKDHSKVKNHSTRRPQAFSPSSALPSSPGMLFLRRNYCTTAIRSTLSISPLSCPSAFPPTPRPPGRPPGSSASLSAQSTFCSKIPVKICLPETLAVTPKVQAADGLGSWLCP